LVTTPEADARLDPVALIPDVSLACVGRTFQDLPGADEVEKAVIPQPQPDVVDRSEFGVTGVSSMERALPYYEHLGYRVRPSLSLRELTSA
jgi:hypothetical protein